MSTFKRHGVTRRDFIRDVSITTAGAAFAAGIHPVFPIVAEAQESVRGWYRNIYRQLHLDAHLGSFDKIYRNFDAEAAAQIFKEAGFQMVSYMAMDGPSYYPTKIGVPHQGLDRDFVGEMTGALKERGIRTIVYISASSEPRFHKEHPDWIYNRDPSREVVDITKVGNMASICLNSPWVEEVAIPQYKEILEWYDVDGFFIDGVHQPYLESNCYCKYCRELYDKEVGGNIPTDDSDPKAFAYRKWANRHMEAYMEKVYRVLSAIKPGIAILNNGQWMVSRYPVTPPDYVMHVCWDTPTPGYGFYSYNFSEEGRYLSTLVDVRPDITWSCMDIDGYLWSDYTMREQEAFMHESAILLAACGRTYLSDNPYPSGNPDKALMDAYTSVNKRTVELETYLKKCKPVKDVAVLHSADSVWSKAPILPCTGWRASPAYQSVCGAHKALIEGHVQMGIVNSEVFLKTIDNYNALILPDQRILSEEESTAVRRFVKNGGVLIATGETGLHDRNDNRLDNFSIADVLGIDYQGTSDSINSYLRIPETIEKFRLPAYDIQVVGNYVVIKTTTARTLVEMVPPYEGKKTGSPPPAEHTEGPGITINSYGKGKAVYCASRVFEAYFIENTPNLRKLGLWLLDLIYPDKSRTIVFENTPVNVEVFYNERGNERFAHLVNFNADKREYGSPSVQDFIAVHGIRVKVRLKNRPISITTVPGGGKVAFTYRNGWASFESEPLEIHSIYRIEL
ncbi:beta-galactosidase trimerization domain-containing protein [Candidatus Latescibacterota bacterium]